MRAKKSFNRDGRYYFRRPIPVELRPALNDRVEFKVSLKTSNKTEAKRKCEALAAETSAQLDDARMRLNPQRRESFTAIELGAFAADVKARWLRTDEVGRVDATPKQLHEMRNVNADMVEALSDGDLRAVVQREVADLLQTRSLVVTSGTPAAYQITAAVREGVREALGDAMRRDKGEWVPSPDLPSPSASLLVSQLVDQWVSFQPRPAKTVDEARRTWNAFIALHGDIPGASIVKAQGIALREKFKASGNTDGTVRKKIGFINAVLNHAVADDLLPSNPVRGIKLGAKGAEVERLPFTVPQMASLFALPLFTAGKRSKTTRGEALFWLPLMSLYSGARLTELAQLRVTDFHEEPSGLGVYFEIQERDAGNTVKTEGSARNVPVHTELVRLGLLRYVEAQRKKGRTFLFPEIPRLDGRCNVDPLSKAFGRLLDAVGIVGKEWVFHSFRHTFIYNAREVKIDNEVRRAITGHDGDQDVHDGYGGQRSLSTLFEAMGQYRVQGLNLAAVKALP